MCERHGRCHDGGEEEESDSDEEAKFDVDHFDPVNRGRIQLIYGLKNSLSFGLRIPAMSRDEDWLLSPPRGGRLANQLKFPKSSKIPVNQMQGW